MIDWNKSIEVKEDGEWRSAWLLEKSNDGSFAVAYRHANGHTIDYFNNSGFPISDIEAEIRNKPELIEPEGWVGIRSDGSFTACFMHRRTAAVKNPDAILTADELISGKFKDGIPKGYGLRVDDD